MIKICCLFVFIFLSNAYALISIGKGPHVVEGKLLVDKPGIVNKLLHKSQEQYYVLLNEGTNSEVVVKVDGEIPGEMKKLNKKNVEIELNFNNDCRLSSRVDAKLIRFIKMLDPFHDVKIYRDLKNNVLKDAK